MAKSLTEPPPSSSVANALIESAARATTQPGQPLPPRVRAVEPPMLLVLPARAPESEAAVISREYVLTPSADDTSSDLTELFRRATKARLNHSTMIRCLLKAARHAIQHIEHEANRIGPLQLPPKGDDVQRRTFEDRLTAAFVAGFRACGAYLLSETEMSD